jgi:hypothetical protein
MSFISASGLPLEVSSIDVTGNVTVQGDLAVDKHFYQRDSAGGVVIEDDIVIGSARYDQLVGAPNTIKVFRTTNSGGAVVDSLTLANTGAVFTGTVSSGNAVDVPPSAWNNTALVDGALTPIYTSPALAIGTYLVNAQASVTCATGFSSYEAMYIDELAHAYEDITVIGVSTVTEIVLKWSQIFKVTSTSNDTFGLLVRCSGVGALNLIECAALNTGGYGFVEFIKVA